MTPVPRYLAGLMAVFLLLVGGPSLHAEKPNVILILTDDQGYGDMSCHGNPVLKTPHIDAIHAESVRFTDFHTSPLCTPTRAALLTGRHPGRVGAYRTSSGRTMLHPDEKTMADLFAANGYQTGMVGKWHLGDNAPHRPQDRGFQDSIWHRCGGIGQISDHWGNTYYDAIFERNGEPERIEGYCTDVWFEEAMNFVVEKGAKPFFLYLATNAPHSPYIVDEKWSDPYRESAPWGAGAEFYGMIANLDHNLGMFRKQLEAMGQLDNTIFIFMSDNGTGNGAKFPKWSEEPSQGFNAGMRGKKAALYEGGHRMPFFIRWPDGGIDGGRDIDSLAAHIDVLPTLADLCGFELSDDHKPDGISFAPMLKDLEAPAHRDHLVMQFQGGRSFEETPRPWKFSYIMQGKWRLIHGKELYNLANDPAQRNDIAAEHPEIVKQMRSHYMPFWKEVAPGMYPVPIDLGNPSENPVHLTCQDWYLPVKNPPWRFNMVAKLPRVVAPWHVRVQQAGRYRITLRQWPLEADRPIVAKRAKLEVAGVTVEADVEPDVRGVVFEVDLPAGDTELWTYLYDENDEAGGAYFTDVEALELASQ